MKTNVGIFSSRQNAEQAIKQLRAIGVGEDSLSILTPAASQQEIEAIPTSETEQPGMGKALGGVVGGAGGLAAGGALGTAIASVTVPGVGPVIALGIAATVLGGAGGAAVGATAGGALENAMSPGLPQDELFVYEDALRQGRTVVVALTEPGDPTREAHSVLEQAGAESVDAAREQWWIGLRDAEQASYHSAAEDDFSRIEETYRRGFEAALAPQGRGKSYQQAMEYIRERYPTMYHEAAFRHGYERGQTYHQRVLAQHQANP